MTNVRSKSDAEGSEIDCIEGQNMKTKKCKFVTQIDYWLDQEYKDLSPAYVQVGNQAER